MDLSVSGAGMSAKLARPNVLADFDPASAWARLPPAMQAKIGALTVEWAFSTFVSGILHGPADRLCDAEIRAAADQRACELLQIIPDRLEVALPDLFGLPGKDPPWAWREPG
jgi:hypothetical protein